MRMPFKYLPLWRRQMRTQTGGVAGVFAASTRHSKEPQLMKAHTQRRFLYQSRWLSLSQDVLSVMV